MACKVSYSKLNDLFLKSLQFDYEKYRDYRNSIIRLATLPNLTPEAKVRSIWYMGLLYNKLLATDDNLITKNLPYKINELSKTWANATRDFESDSFTFSNILQDILALVNESYGTKKNKFENLSNVEISDLLTSLGEANFNKIVSTLNVDGDAIIDSEFNQTNKTFEEYTNLTYNSFLKYLSVPSEDLGKMTDAILFNDNYYTPSEFISLIKEEIIKTNPNLVYNNLLEFSFPEEADLTPSPVPVKTVNDLMNESIVKLRKAKNTEIVSIFNEFKSIVEKNFASLEADGTIRAYDVFKNELGKKSNSPQKKSILAQIETLTDVANTQVATSFINIGDELGLGKDMYVVRKKDGSLINLAFKDGKYYLIDDTFNGSNFEEFKEYTIESTDYITPFYYKPDSNDSTNSGDKRRLRSELTKNGITFFGVRQYEKGVEKNTSLDNRTGIERIADGLAPGIPFENQIKIIADRRRINLNRERLAKIQEKFPQITNEVYLTPQQIKFLQQNPGKYVAGFVAPAGVNAIQFSVTDRNGDNLDYLTTLDTLAFIGSDNSIIKIDFNNPEHVKLFSESVTVQKWSSVKNSFEYQTPTGADINTIATAIQKVKQLKERIIDEMGDSDVYEVPYSLFNEYFNITNAFSKLEFNTFDKDAFKVKQTLGSFADKLVTTNSAIKTRVADIQFGEVRNAREASVVGIIKRNEKGGFDFESSLPSTSEIKTVPIDENDNPISIEQLFVEKGFDKQKINKIITASGVSSYLYFYVVKTSTGWSVRPMKKVGPITNKTEVVDFMISLAATKDFRVKGDSEEVNKERARQIQTFNNRGWGFNPYNGIIANIDYITTIAATNDQVFGIKFRAEKSYPLAKEFEEQFSKPENQIQFPWEKYDIDKQLNVILSKLGIKLSDYNSLEERINLGKIVAQKLRDNQAALDKQTIAAIDKINVIFNNSISQINSQIESIKNRHAEHVDEGGKPYLTDDNTLKYTIFEDLAGSQIKLSSKFANENPLDNFKVFEKNLADIGQKKIYITQAAAPVITDPNIPGPLKEVKSVTPTSGVIAPEQAPVSKRGRDIKWKLVSSLEDIKTLSDEEFKKEVEDVQRMIGDISIELGDLSDTPVTGRALGYFENNAIRLDNVIKAAGVAYHEAFHAIFRMALTPEERTRYLNAVKDILGDIKKDSKGSYVALGSKKVYLDDFRKNRKFYGIADEVIKNLIYEEYLADGYRDYKYEKKEPKNKLLLQFYKFLDRIISFITSKKYKAAREIQGLYKSIDEGAYATRRNEVYNAPVAYELAFIPSRIDNKAQIEYYQIDGETNDQLKNRILREMFKRYQKVNKEGFNKVYDEVTRELIKYYSLDTLINQNPDNKDAIVTRYAESWNGMRYIMGSLHREDANETYVLENLSKNKLFDKYTLNQDATAIEYSKDTFEEFRDQVQADYDKEYIISTDEEEETDRENDVLDEDAEISEENREEEIGDLFTEKEMHLSFKPYEGSREFRRQLNYIEYDYIDDNLGVKFTKMVNNKHVMNSLWKISANVSLKQIIPNLVRNIELLKSNIDEFNKSKLERKLGNKIPQDMVNTINKYNMLNAVFNQLKDTAGLEEVVSGDTVEYIATRAEGIPFYKMFHKVFYNAKIEVLTQSISTQKDGDNFTNSFSEKRLIEQHDIYTVLNTLRANLNLAVNNLTDDRIDTIKEKLNLLAVTVPSNLKEFRFTVNAIYELTSLAELDIPRNAIEFSVAAQMYEAGTAKKLVSNIVENDYQLYYRHQFFTVNEFKDAFSKFINNIYNDNIESQVNGFVDMYRNIAPFQVKYEPGLYGSMVKNQEGKPISQLFPYTPPIQILSDIKELGMEAAFAKYFPEENMMNWFYDNPWFNVILDDIQFNEEDAGDLQMEFANTLKLFFENLAITVAGGMKQTYGKRVSQSTFRKQGPKSYILGMMGSFANRTVLVNNFGKEYMIFNRPITQNEATSTQFNIDSLYQSYSGAAGVRQARTRVYNIINQEFNRIQREYLQKDQIKNREENYNAKTSEDGVVSTDNSSLRAYNFNILSDFFNRNESTIALKNALIKIAKETNNTLSQSLNEKIGENTIKSILEKELDDYIDYQVQDFDNYLSSLKITDDDIPSSIKENRRLINKKTKKVYFSTKEKSLLKDESEKPLDIDIIKLNKRAFKRDFVLNVWINSMIVNQMFDGDIARGTKDFIDYFKRQKASVAAGNNSRDITKPEEADITVTAVFKKQKFYLDQDNLFTPQTTQKSENLKSVESIDGQAYDNISYRLSKFDKDGLLTEDLKRILKKLRYTDLTTEEKKELLKQDIILNSNKPVIASPNMYVKESEHLLLRSDVSYLTSPDAIDILKDLYDRLDSIDTTNIATDSEVADEYKRTIREIHSYFKPLPNRILLHHLLNSMEYHKIDVVYDENTTKRTTAAPLIIDAHLLEQNIQEGHPVMKVTGEEINSFEDGYINLEYSKRHVTNDLVYDQLKTGHISTMNADSIQSKLLLPALLDPNKAEYKPIKKDIQKIRDLQDEIAKARLQVLERQFSTNDPSTLITKLINAGLLSQGAGKNMLKFFSIDPATGKNKFNLNTPVLGKTPLFYFFSLFNNNVFGPKISGKKYYHVSSWGYKLVIDKDGTIVPDKLVKANPEKYVGYETRYPTVKEEDGKVIVEVIIPRELAETAADVAFFEKLYSEFLGKRIPTEDKRSMVVAKVVGYTNSVYGNSIMVPSQVHQWAGSDLDIDALYTESSDYYRNSLGRLTKFGDYSFYKALGIAEDESKFLEYLHYMANDEAFKELIDSEKIRLKNEDTAFEVSILNGASKFGGNIAKFLQQSEDNLKMLLSKDTFRSLLKGEKIIHRNFEKNAFQLDANTGKMLKMINNMTAVMNILEQYGLPSDPDSLKKFTKKYGNPVTPVLQNQLLTHKLNVLSFKPVYETFVKNSSADDLLQKYRDVKKVVENISSSNTLLNANLFTPQTISRSRSINGKSKDMLGGSASTMKGASVIATSDIKLKNDYSFNFKLGKGKKVKLKDPIQKSLEDVTSSTGMAADDAKEQIAGPLNISLSNVGVLVAMHLYQYDEQFTKILPSVDLISEKLTDYELNNDTSYAAPGVKLYSFPTYFRNQVGSATIEYEKKLIDLGIYKPAKNEKGELIEDTYVLNSDGFTIQYNKLDVSTYKATSSKPSDLGITILDKKNKDIGDELASIVLLNFYGRMLDVGNAISFKFSKLTDVFKKLRPNFDTVRSIQDAAAFMNKNDIFENSDIVFEAYPALKTLAESTIKTMINTSKEVLLDQTNLFKAVTTLFKRERRLTEDQVSTELKSILAFSALSSSIKEKIGKIKDFNNLSDEEERLLAFNDALSADYWIENRIANDIEYLQKKFPDNEFLKVLGLRSADIEGYSDIRVITSIISSQVTPELQERLIDDFNYLMNHSDEDVYRKITKVAIHGMIKDGGVSRTGGYMKIIAPELFTSVSKELDIIQNSLKDIDNIDKKKVTTYVKALDKMFSNLYKKDVTAKGALEAILTKLVSSITTESEYDPGLRMSFYDGSAGFNRGKFGNIPLLKFKSIVDTILPNNNKFIYREGKRKGIPSILPNNNLKTVSDVSSSSYKFELWKGDESGKLMFDLSNISEDILDDTKRILMAQGIYLNKKTGEYSFPLYKINNYEDGQLFILESIDGKRFAEPFFENLFTAYNDETAFEFLLKGKKAVYKIISRQDAGRIKPNAFTNNVAAAINAAVFGESSTTNQRSKRNDILPSSVIAIGETNSMLITNKEDLAFIKGKTLKGPGVEYKIGTTSDRYSIRKGVLRMNSREITDEERENMANRLGYLNYSQFFNDPVNANFFKVSDKPKEFWLMNYLANPIKITTEAEVVAQKVKNISTPEFLEEDTQKILSGEKRTTLRNATEGKKIGLAIGESGRFKVNGKSFIISNRGIVKVTTREQSSNFAISEALSTSKTETNKNEININGIKYYTYLSETVKFLKGEIPLYVFDISEESKDDNESPLCII